MSPRTVYLSRLIGLYCIVASLSMASHKHATVELMTALIQHPVALFIVGEMTLIAGLAMILAHNVWSGGPLPVVVTLVGWLTLIKGLFFSFFSTEAAAGLFARVHYEHFLYLFAGITFIIGAYLTYGGFRSASR